jgi:hypothetical protein
VKSTGTVTTLSYLKQPKALQLLQQVQENADEPSKASQPVDREMMFLICSYLMLSSNHEQSILTCAQAPAG